MSITAARAFRQHVNRMSTLQAEVAPCIGEGFIDYEEIARLGSRSGFDFTAGEARQAFSAPGELSDFEKAVAASALLACAWRKAAQR